MRADARRGPIREESLLLHTCSGESSESMEGDRGRDRVQWCYLLMSFQEGPHQKLFFQGEKILQVRWQTVL